MCALTTTAIIHEDHTLTAQVPEDIPVGVQTVVVVLQNGHQMSPGPRRLEFKPHDVGPADPACTYRREELYDDDGR